MVSNLRYRTDVLVLGGGPAGIAAALAARQQGLSATVVDGCTPPIDKPCGEGLMPDGIAALERLGVSIPTVEVQRFRGIRFVSSGLSVEASFPRGCGFGVRRTNLHRVLVEHAEKNGVQFLWRSVVTGLYEDGAIVQGNRIPARWVIGADGSSSQVRRWAGLDACRQEDTRFAFRRHYRIKPWTDFMELHWAHGAQIYATPVGPEEVCIALISRDSNLRLDDALSRFPELCDCLHNAGYASTERGAVSVTRRLKRVCAGRVALIGDASGSVDAITGEGLCLSFKQAALLGECLRLGDLATYEKGHRVLVRKPALMARLLLSLENRERLRHRVMRVFQADRRIFERMLGIHVGASSATESAMNGLALGLKLFLSA